ncbi:MAG: M42 family peptidase, partial [Alphaproteobacteria bacterium]|nr:M42 family peptidase [Alphaproteobacteria bacterium]
MTDGREMRGRLRTDLLALMAIAGLSGHEDRVRRWLRSRLGEAGIEARGDRLGNLIATL